MAAVLVLLGARRNFGVVGGSALLVASVPEAVRSEMEGIGDVAMSLAAAVGAPGSGLIAGISDYRTLSFVVTRRARRALAVPMRPFAARRCKSASFIVRCEGSGVGPKMRREER
jgi:hypothetical protein